MTTYGTPEQIAAKKLRLSNQKTEVVKLKDDQRTGGMNMIKANRSAKHKIREIEKDFVHLELITKESDSMGKTIDEKRHIHICTTAEFNQAIEENLFGTYSGVEVIHDPQYIPPKRKPKKKTTK